MRIRRLAVLLVLALGVGACSPGGGSGGELEGTTWVLRSYANGGTLEIVPEALYADARFTRRPGEWLRGLQRLRRARSRQRPDPADLAAHHDPEGVRRRSR